MHTHSFLIAGLVTALHGATIRDSDSQEPNQQGPSLDSLRLELNVQRKKLYLPINDLNRLYESQLEKLQETVRRKGNLDKVLVLQEEGKSFAESGPKAVEDFPELTNLQQLYQRELTRRKKSREENLGLLLAAYLKHLTALEKSLTTANRLEEALSVRKESDHIRKDIARKPSKAGDPGDGGKLAGFGLGSKADPVGDTAKNYNDFISVRVWEQEGSGDGWVALRKNGSVVTHKDRRASPSGEKMIGFACSESGGIVMIRDDGTVNTDLCQYQPSEKAAARLTGIVDVAMGHSSRAGEEAIVAVRSDGTLVCWGPGCEKDGAQEIPEVSGSVIVTVEGSHGLFAGLKSDGSLILWTFHSGGDRRLAIPVEHGSRKFKQVAMSESHLVALTTNGTVVAWGGNTEGQCNVPAELGPCDQVRAILNVASVARKTDGTWVAWGRDFGGVRDKINQVGKFQDIAGKLFPPFKYAYAVWIEEAQ